MSSTVQSSPMGSKPLCGSEPKVLAMSSIKENSLFFICAKIAKFSGKTIREFKEFREFREHANLPQKHLKFFKLPNYNHDYPHDLISCQSGANLPAIKRKSGWDILSRISHSLFGLRRRSSATITRNYSWMRYVARTLYLLVLYGSRHTTLSAIKAISSIISSEVSFEDQ